jgi:hypothetical protein
MAQPQVKTYFKKFTSDAQGQIFMTGPLDVSTYEKIDVEIVQWPQAPVKLTAKCAIGKISGETLAEEVASFPLSGSGKIHSFDVVGPEFSVVLTGATPKATVPIQGWVFLH